MKILTIAIAITIVGCGRFDEDRHVVGPYSVVEVPPCHAESHACPLKMRSKFGALEFYKYDSSYQVMVGQLVYKECWTEELKRFCFSTVTPSPRNSYAEGGFRN